jgi:hypothetical protein
LVAAIYVVFAASNLLAAEAAGPAAFREWLGIALLSTACLSLLLAWRWELIGAVVSLIALTAFAVVIQLPQPWVLAVIALPSVLYVLDWVSQRPALHPTN